jgi:MFS family permease
MLPASLKTLWLNDRTRLAVITALLAMVAINQAGTGLLFALIPVKLAADGYPASAAGAISTVFSICFLVGCVVGPRIIGWFGAYRTPVVLAGFNALLALLHWAFPGLVTWSLFRGAGGVATATYFVLIECWLASQTTPATRGLVFGFYMVMNRLAFAFGQLIIAFVDPSSLMQLFLVSALAYLVSPLLRPRATGAIPTMTSPSLATYLELPRLVPAAAAASLMHGLVFGSVPGLVPKWGVDAGIGVGAIAEALVAMQLGGLVMQLPISYASDRLERRTVMAAVALGTAITSLVVLQMSVETRWTWLAVMFLWGGFASTLYSLAAAHANDLAPPEKRVAWVSSIMLLWGTGAALGPLVASLLMDWRGTPTLWTYSAVVSAAIGSFMMWRKAVRP